MGFHEFLGNEHIVAALRAMLKRERVPHAMLFTGPRGVGKYTLARMFAQAANCERLIDDFCGECSACKLIAQLADPAPLIERGVAERGENPDTAAIERTPLILQTHPDVWAIVPDPVRLRNPVVRPVIRMGQLRAVQRAAYFMPGAPGARRRVFILDGAETMRFDYANIFLKILEEPPESATLLLMAPSPDALLPTIRSRCLPFFFAPLAAEKIESFLNERTDWNAADRRLAAQLSGGCPGIALTLDLEESARVRRAVVHVLELAVEGHSYRKLFETTAQLAKGETESFENIIALMYSVVTDLVEFRYGSKSRALRNPDLRQELETLSRKVDFDWARGITNLLDSLYGRLRRNVNRQLGLEAAVLNIEACQH